jgi:hypothetical protein
MTLSNEQMYDIFNVLREIGEKDIDCVTGVNIARNLDRLADMLKPVDQAKMGLVEKYGKKNEKGKVEISKNGEFLLDDGEGYAKESQLLSSAEAEIDLILFSMDNIRFMSPTPNQIRILLPIIKED